MSGRRRLILGALVALTLVLVSPMLAFARAGGGESFGGGGGLGGGGFDGGYGGGGGFGGGGFLLPFFLFGGGGGGFIFFLFILFALFQAYRRMSLRHPIQASNWGPSYAPMAQMRSTLNDDLAALRLRILDLLHTDTVHPLPHGGFHACASTVACVPGRAAFWSSALAIRVPRGLAPDRATSPVSISTFAG